MAFPRLRSFGPNRHMTVMDGAEKQPSQSRLEQDSRLDHGAYWALLRRGYSENDIRSALASVRSSDVGTAAAPPVEDPSASADVENQAQKDR